MCREGEEPQTPGSSVLLLENLWSIPSDGSHCSSRLAEPHHTGWAPGSSGPSGLGAPSLPLILLLSRSWTKRQTAGLCADPPSSPRPAEDYSGLPGGSPCPPTLSRKGWKLGRQSWGSEPAGLSGV